MPEKALFWQKKVKNHQNSIDLHKDQPKQGRKEVLKSYGIATAVPKNKQTTA